MDEIEINTNLFYEELFNSCNPDTLLKIAQKGICLYYPLYKYEKIKNHEYVVDISIISKQHFMIFNNIQYNRVVHYLINTDEYIFASKIIINKFFLDKIINETYYNVIDKYIDKLYNYSNTMIPDYLIKYLLKYDYITIDFNNLFSIHENNIYFDLMEYLHFNNKNYYFNDNFNYNNYREIVELYIIDYCYNYDINLLDYCLNISNTNKIRIPQNFNSDFKFASYLPLNMLKKYVEIFEPNKLKFVILDNIEEKTYYEEIINILVSDYCFYYIMIYKKNYLLFDYNLKVLKKYNVDPTIIKHYEIQNIGNNKIFNFESFYNKNIYENKKNLDTLSKDVYPFSKNLLSNPDKLNSILCNSNYLLNLNIKLIDKKHFGINDSDCKDKYILILIYIISLLHNSGNYFIMYSLLKYIRTSIKLKNNKICFVINENNEGSSLMDLLLKTLYVNKKYDYTTYVKYESI